MTQTMIYGRLCALKAVSEVVRVVEQPRNHWCAHTTVPLVRYVHTFAGPAWLILTQAFGQLV